MESEISIGQRAYAAFHKFPTAADASEEWHKTICAYTKERWEAAGNAAAVWAVQTTVNKRES